MYTKRNDNVNFKAVLQYQKLKHIPKHLRRAATEFKKNTIEYPDFTLIFEGKDNYNMHYFSLCDKDGIKLASSELKLPKTLLKNRYSKEDNLKLIEQKYVAYHLQKIFQSLMAKITK